MRLKLLIGICSGIVLLLPPGHSLASERPQFTPADKPETAIAIQPAKTKKPPKEQRKAKHAQKRRIDLINKYGLSMQQVGRMEDLITQTRRNLSAIKSLALPRQERIAKRKQILNSHRKNIESIFTPEQYARYTANKAENRTIAKIRTQILRDYAKERRKTAKIAAKDRREARKQLTEKYVRILKTYVKPGIARHMLYQVNKKQYAHTAGIKQLKLSKAKRLKMGELRLRYENRQLALRNQNLPTKERKAKLKEYKTGFRDKIKKHIGSVKYAQWIAYKAGSHQRHYKKTFGFTPEQYNQYKEIENKKAVRIMRIRKSAIPKEQKAAKIESVRQAKIESLRNILDGAQFDKWYTVYCKKQQKQHVHKAKRQKS